MRLDDDVEIPAGGRVTLALKLEGVARDSLTPVELEADPGLAMLGIETNDFVIHNPHTEAA